MSFVNANGHALYCRVEGRRDGIPLVFINSLGCDLRIWDEVIPTFQDRFQIVRYDKRGHGASDSPPGPKIGDHADDLLGLLDQLKINTAVIIGISVGGMIAQRFAAQHPERVRLLVLCDTGLTIGTPEGWNSRIAGIREGGMAAMADAIIQRWVMPDFARMRPADYRGYLNMLLRMPVDGYIATCEAIRDANLTENARKIQARTLVIGGEQDQSTPPDVLKGLAGALTHARLELIGGAAHLPCIEQPGIMAANIDWFLQENGYA